MLDEQVKRIHHTLLQCVYDDYRWTGNKDIPLITSMCLWWLSRLVTQNYLGQAALLSLKEQFEKWIFTADYTFIIIFDIHLTIISCFNINFSKRTNSNIFYEIKCAWHVLKEWVFSLYTNVQSIINGYLLLCTLAITFNVGLYCLDRHINIQMSTFGNTNGNRNCVSYEIWVMRPMFWY